PRALAHERAPRLRVRAREQALRRNLDEVRIAVVRVAIGERELHRLDEAMQIRRRIVAEPLEVDAVEHVEHLEEDGALTPEAADRHLVLAESSAQRLRDFDLVAREIFERQRAVFAAMELRDALRGLAAIELVARGADAGLARAAGLALGAHHAPERLAQL